MFATTAFTWSFTAVKRSPVSLSPAWGDVSVLPAIVRFRSARDPQPVPARRDVVVQDHDRPEPTVPYDTANPSSLLNPEFSRIVFPEKTVLCLPEEYPTCTVAWRNVIP